MFKSTTNFISAHKKSLVIATLCTVSLGALAMFGLSGSSNQGLSDSVFLNADLKDSLVKGIRHGGKHPKLSSKERD
jgi:hypothetical protein